eukprot:1216170-Rhodomonas_salina.1
MFVESEGAKRNTENARDSRSSGSSAQRTAAMTVEDPLDPASNLARHVTAGAAHPSQIQIQEPSVLAHTVPSACVQCN